jgi:hypothetical protein
MCKLSAAKARWIWFLFVAVCLPQADLSAQSGTSVAPSVVSVAPKRSGETRAQLQAAAEAAERQKRASEAWLLRSRLERGDFQEGDRIVVVLEGSAPVIDTLQVRTGKTLHFPRMGELSLDGVLRSELTETVRNHLQRYLTSPNVRVTPLLPIAVLGLVAAPGFYYTPADVVLRDVIMRAGGPLVEADISKIVLRRGGEVIWSEKDVRTALSDGLSLDALHLRSGDELVVPKRRSIQMTALVALISSSVALTVAVVNLMQ